MEKKKKRFSGRFSAARMTKKASIEASAAAANNIEEATAAANGDPGYG